MKKKKIVFYETYYSSFTGAQQSLYWLLKGLNKDKFEPIVITPGKGELINKAKKIGIKAKVIKYSSNLNVFDGKIKGYSFLKKLFVLISLIRYNISFLKYLIKEKPDILYCNNLRGVLTIGILAKLLTIPLLWYVRIDTSNGIFDKIGTRLADKIITISEGVRDIFDEKYLKKKAYKFETIYTGFNLKEYDDNKGAKFKFDEEIIIGTAGSITLRKGYDDFVDMARELNRVAKNIKFVIAGEPPRNSVTYYNKLKRKIKNYNLEKKIKFVGWVDDITDFLSSIDLFVLCSKNEGLPRVVIEAMAMAKPVVATNAGGTNEAIDNGKTGFIVDKGNKNELVAKIEYMIDNKEEMKEMGKEGRRKVENDFSLKTYISKFENLLDSI
ncbi:glycosyltransferase [Iocasia frigidifontis]|uniref:glycosyltransferase n=1 Tax=Iocasia fonsfrigidae TaxID=2682810 RepID=UPI001E400BA5|nr:glycosyltransferase [Iocasia fonsfrigidae]